MKTVIATICILFSLGTAQAQETIIFSGKIETTDFHQKKKTFKSSKKAKESTIIIYEGAQVLDKMQASDKGDFSIFLRPDLVYKIEFQHEGYISKCVQIDTRNLPIEYLMEDRKVYSDITLFERVAGVSFNAYERLPVAKCSYDRGFENMIWDMSYAEQTYATFLRLVQSSQTSANKRVSRVPGKILEETITEEHTDYDVESAWLNLYLQQILAKL